MINEITARDAAEIARALVTTETNITISLDYEHDEYVVTVRPFGDIYYPWIVEIMDSTGVSGVLGTFETCEDAFTSCDRFFAKEKENKAVLLLNKHGEFDGIRID